jgi:NIMA (never in mitosis gene a)-related kinase 2
LCYVVFEFSRGLTLHVQSYDTKSDIWSLGCLVYELCALKPPFHEARTHAELAALIQNGRIPPLPKCYSSNLFAVIKQMLHLNVRNFV